MRWVTAPAGLATTNLIHRALYIGVVMGRHAGFLTAAAALARQHSHDGPHLIYVPERESSLERFLEDVREVYGRYGRCVIAVSEGIVDASGTPVALAIGRSTEADAHGNLNLSGRGLGEFLKSCVQEALGMARVRSDTFGYVQRSFPLVVSQVDRSEAREVGQKAVQFAIFHDRNGSVTIHRIGDYAVDYRLTALDCVARATRTMPREWMNDEGNQVTMSFLKYASPLVESFPPAARLRAPAVSRIALGRRPNAP